MGCGIQTQDLSSRSSRVLQSRLLHTSDLDRDAFFLTNSRDIFSTVHQLVLKISLVRIGITTGSKNIFLVLVDNINSN